MDIWKIGAEDYQELPQIFALLIDTSLFLSIQVDIFGYICFLQYG
jgi:hypothetical protein